MTRRTVPTHYFRWARKVVRPARLRNAMKYGAHRPNEVREIARALGGTLEVESAPGQGATFTLTLPRYPEEPRGGDLGDASAPRG